MADVVQFHLERMVDELDDLEHQGLFSRREINEIVKKRRGFEYRLKRPCPLKQDFIAYVEYEKKIDSLRMLRRKAMIREMKKTNRNKKWKKSFSDKAGIRRIMTIFRLAVQRYKGDLDIWFRYLEFCRERKNGRMKEVLAQVIRFHPKIPGLWIYAAAWEFDNNLNVAAARALMQRGLRVCPQSEDLWVEYLRMELTYIKKLKARKIALEEGIGSFTSVQNNVNAEEWKTKNRDLFMPFIAERETENCIKEQDGVMGRSVDALEERGLILFKFIYRAAVEAVPENMNLRKQFLNVLANMNLSHENNLKTEILNDMKKEFSEREEYWDWLGKLQFSHCENRNELTEDIILSQLSHTVKVYEEALDVVPSAKMFSLYVAFWLDLILPERRNSKYIWLSSSLICATKFATHLLDIFEKARSRGCLTEDLAYQYVAFYLHLGKLEEAIDLVKNLCSEEFSEATKLWVLRMSMEMKWTTTKSSFLSKHDLNSLFETMSTLLAKLAISEAENLWIMAIKFFSVQREYFEKLVQIFFASKARWVESNASSSLCSIFVNWALTNGGVHKAREMYKRFFNTSRPSLASYEFCIELESNFAFAGSKDGLENARKLYELALGHYSQNVGLWRNYYQMEVKAGTSETANAVHWRANKVLRDKVMLTSRDCF